MRTGELNTGVHRPLHRIRSLYCVPPTARATAAENMAGLRKPQAVRTKAALFRQHRQNPQVPSLRLRYTDARRRASKMVREAWSTYWINIGTGISQDFVKGNIGHGLSPISNLVHRRPRLQPQDEVDLIAHTEYVLTNISRVSPDAPPH